MTIHRVEPIFTIGRTPFVAGAVHVRNQLRLLKQRERASRQKAFLERLRRLPGTLLRRLPSRPGQVLEGGRGAR